MSIMSQIRDLFAASGLDLDADEEPDTLGAGETDEPELDSGELPEPLGDDEADPAPAPDDAEAALDTPDAGAAGAPGSPEADQEATLPEGETTADELRVALSEAWSTIEDLRNQLALLTGSAEATTFDPTPDEPDELEPEAEDDEYDDDAAEADIAEQRRQIAELSGK